MTSSESYRCRIRQLEEASDDGDILVVGTMQESMWCLSPHRTQEGHGRHVRPGTRPEGSALASTGANQSGHPDHSLVYLGADELRRFRVGVCRVSHLRVAAKDWGDE